MSNDEIRRMLGVIATEVEAVSVKMIKLKRKTETEMSILIQRNNRAMGMLVALQGEVKP